MLIPNTKPLYYNGKEVKIIWECKEFSLVEIMLIDLEKAIFVDKQALSNSTEVPSYISTSLFEKECYDFRLF